ARAGAASSRAGAGARAAFRAACARNEAAHARRQLLEWIAAEWPPPPPPGLNALARQIEDARLADLLRELDRACYAAEPWQGAPLAAALEKLPPRKRDPSDRSASIAPLYP
ncbi:MAG: BatD family protein, partial [Steroidobacteraceae bacterium]